MNNLLSFVVGILVMTVFFATFSKEGIKIPTIKVSVVHSLDSNYVINKTTQTTYRR